MAETLKMMSERVDDLPWWLAQLARMGVQPLRDEHVPRHGHWVGRPVGWVTVIWVPPIVSQATQRRHHGEPWAAPRRHTLRRGTGPSVHPRDVRDDRPAAVLEALRGDAGWSAFEGALSQHPWRLDDLGATGVRLDRTTANGYGTVTADGLCLFGHRQDHRPALPPVKSLVSALQPLGLPVATDVGPGQRADALRYRPALTRVREGLGQRGLRARMAKAPAEGTARHERRRGRRRDPGPSAGRAAVDTILTRDRGHGLRHVWSTKPCWERPRRRSGGRDATRRLAWDGPVSVSLDPEAVAAAVRQLGWRVSVTTHPPDQWSRQEAILAYRHAYLVERARGRRNGRPLSLTPRSRERTDQATGWIRLVSLGLRGRTRLACEVRRRVALATTTRSGWSIGTPQRATARPTAERLLETCQGLTLPIIRAGHRRRRHLTQLARVPQHLLARLDFPVDISLRLCRDAHKPPSK